MVLGFVVFWVNLFLFLGKDYTERFCTVGRLSEDVLVLAFLLSRSLVGVRSVREVGVTRFRWFGYFIWWVGGLAGSTGIEVGI